MIGRIPEHLNLPKQTAAICQYREREILFDMPLVIDKPNLVRLADTDNQGALSGGSDLPGLSSHLAKHLSINLQSPI